MIDTRGTEFPQWSAIAPVPAPLRLGAEYDRHHAADASVTQQLHALVDGRDWAASTWPELIETLLAFGRTDVGLSRLAEGHVDAVRIAAQAGAQLIEGALYGVWASRSQRTGVRATPAGTQLILDGTLRFASGLGVIDRALVPVWTGTDRHLLIDLDLASVGGPELESDTGQWQTAAMEVSRSHTLTVAGFRVEASGQLGADNFYLDRPGFFPGGVGVAACWLGGAARVADLVSARLVDPLPVTLQLRLGEIRRHLSTGSGLLSAAARRLAADDAPQAVSAETRWAVAAAVHGVLDQAHFLAGPAGLAFDRDLTRAVHDLRLYVLQHNPDADALFLAQLSRP